MFQWIPYAMVRIAAFFIAGILLGIYNPQLLEPEFAQILLCGLVLAYLIYCLIARNQMKRTPLTGVIGLLAVFMAGYVHLSLYVEWNKTNHLSKVEPQLIHAYVAEVRELPEEKEKSWKYTLQVLQVHDGESWTTVSAKTLLYIKKEAQQPVYFYGNKILIQGSPELLSPPQNPHEFDFKRFLTFKNIYHQQFVRTDQVQFVSSIQNKDFKYYSLLARQWAGSQLKKQLRNPKEQAIAMALTLGITDGIDNDLQNAYAASGAMHVLAVSGLHVGIIYGIVLLLFK
ncbi:MAG: ComEC family competence protein, partial [Cyclobacteriaceae bacterium]